jgi:hypothetical protein
MTTSNSYDFTVNRNEIIESALQQISEIAEGQPMTADHIAKGSRWLNLIVKQWQGNSDAAPGFKVWSRKRGYVFLQKNKHDYALGSSGWHATNSYSTTTISTAEALGQTVLSVTSTTGMTAADNIGIQLDDGTIQWTTIVSTGAGPTVTVTAALTAAAASGNRVFWYTNKLYRPIEIIIASLLDVNGNEEPVDPITFEEYESLSKKTADGTPCAYYYEAQLANGVLYTDVEPTDVTKVLRIVYLANIQDFDILTDTPDYPQEYNLALVMELAKYLAPVYGRKFTPEMMINRNDAILAAKSLYPETTDLYFQPGASG